MALILYSDVTAGTLYRGYFLNGKRCGVGTLHFLNKQIIQKGFWKDGICVTSIQQNDTDTGSGISLGRLIPKVQRTTT